MHKLLQTSWTAFFGVLAAVESIVLAWCAEKMYKVWSNLFLFVATRWPWGNVDADVDVDAETESAPDAPKRAQRQPAIDARDVCYILFDA